jgi:hypothetical protein
VEARRLLEDEQIRDEMRAGLAEVSRRLAAPEREAPERAAIIIQDILEGQVAHVL